MLRQAHLIFPLGLALVSIGLNSAMADTNWKRGRIYYRLVCTACHKAETGQTISPSTRTMAEWKAYMHADKHASSGKAKPKVSYYISTEYRESVKDSNKAAARLIALPEQDLLQDITAFVVHGAKDSDTPATCD